MGQLIARGQSISFFYEDTWLSRRDAFPLSLSLSLAAREHPNRVVEPYLWNLLPDNHSTLVSWAKRFNVKLNPFSLLENVGEDVAGAAQFVRPDRLHEVMQGEQGQVQWIDEAELARRIRELRIDKSSWSQVGDVGYFSLPGAQPKMALLNENGRWGIPSGRIPTTHIIKPPIPEFADFAQNEHFCLRLASAIGLPTANTSVQSFRDEQVFVTERFDRIRFQGQLIRVPAEDLCQALGVHPEDKYQNRGGPTPETIFKLLLSESTQSEEDCARFFDALVFNALIGGTDAHAKNYTILHGSGRVRLAPLYDIASAFPYYDVKKLKLAMKIGSHYEPTSINARDWDRLGNVAGIDSPRNRVRAIANSLSENVDNVFKSIKVDGLQISTIENIRNGTIEQVKRTLNMLDAAEKTK